MARIREAELVLPALSAIKSAEKACLTMTELVRALRHTMVPTGKDLEPSKGRRDDRFSQKVRNLESHRTLKRSGYVEMMKKGGDPAYSLSKKGAEYLDLHQESLSIIGEFPYDEKGSSLAAIHNSASAFILPEYMPQEGLRKGGISTRMTRSSKLRDIAIDYFSVNGRIDCKVCAFNFDDTYGKRLSDGFIEIHHLRPICLYTKEDIDATLDTQLENLAPVCSNCHSIIHRKIPQLPLEKISINRGSLRA